MAFCRAATVVGILLTIYGVFGLIYVVGFQYREAFALGLEQLGPEQYSALRSLFADSVRKSASALVAGVGLGAIGEVGKVLRNPL